MIDLTNIDMSFYKDKRQYCDEITINKKVQQQKRCYNELIHSASELGLYDDYDYKRTLQLEIIKKHYTDMKSYFDSFAWFDSKFKAAFRRHYGITDNCFYKLGREAKKFIVVAKDLGWMDCDLNGLLKVWEKEERAIAKTKSITKDPKIIMYKDDQVEWEA